jgi:hypothetical protein
MQEEKREKVRINPTFDVSLHAQIKKLAKTCDISKSDLVRKIVEIGLSNPQFINYLQDKHGVPRNERIYPVTVNGKLQF